MAAAVPTEVYHCGPCKTDKTLIDADHYCETCHEYLCTGCRAQHSKLKILKDHNVLPLLLEMHECDPCKTDGTRKEAPYYCAECSSYLCYTCRDHHRKLSVLRGHDVSLVKALSELNISQPEETKPLDTYYGDDVVNQAMQFAHEVNIKLPTDISSSAITGSTFLSDGKLLLCDHNNFNLKLLDSYLVMQETLALDSRPWDVAALDDRTALVTLYQSKCYNI